MSNRRAQLISALEKGLHYFSIGQFEKARSFWEEALKLDPNNAQAQEFMLYVSDDTTQLAQPAPPMPPAQPHTKKAAQHSAPVTSPPLSHSLTGNTQQPRAYQHFIEREQKRTPPPIFSTQPIQGTGFLSSSIAQIEELLIPMDDDIPLQAQAIEESFNRSLLSETPPQQTMDEYLQQIQQSSLFPDKIERPLLSSEDEHPLKHNIHPPTHHSSQKQHPNDFQEPSAHGIQDPLSLVGLETVPEELTPPSHKTPSHKTPSHKTPSHKTPSHKTPSHKTPSNKKDLSTRLLPALSSNFSQEMFEQEMITPQPKVSPEELLPQQSFEAKQQMQVQETEELINQQIDQQNEKPRPVPVADLIEEKRVEKTLSSPPNDATLNMPAFVLDLPNADETPSFDNNPFYESESTPEELEAINKTDPSEELSNCFDVPTPPPLDLSALQYIEEAQVQEEVQEEEVSFSAPEDYNQTIRSFPPAHPNESKNPTQETLPSVHAVRHLQTMVQATDPAIQAYSPNNDEPLEFTDLPSTTAEVDFYQKLHQRDEGQWQNEEHQQTLTYRSHNTNSPHQYTQEQHIGYEYNQESPTNEWEAHSTQAFDPFAIDNTLSFPPTEASPAHNTSDMNPSYQQPPKHQEQQSPSDAPTSLEPYPSEAQANHDPFPYEPIEHDPFPYEPSQPIEEELLSGFEPKKLEEEDVLQLNNVFEEDDEFLFGDADTPDAPIKSIHEQIAYLPSAALRHEQVEFAEPKSKASPDPLEEDDEVSILLIGAKDLLSEAEYRSAMELLEMAKKQAPDHPEVSALYEQCLEEVDTIYAEEIQSLALVPQVKYSMEEIMRLEIDHRVGFLISQMDGFTSLSDLIILTGFTEMELIRVIGQLKDQGVIVLEER